MKNRGKFINKCIDKARAEWGIDPQWQIDWEWDENCQSSAEIDLSRYTEKVAFITISSQLHKEGDLDVLRRDLSHEVGHVVLYPIDRGLSDYADHFIKGRKLRAVYEEQLNTRENEVLDHIITKIFKI